MAKILITGATGFVGKKLIIYLLEQGHEIYALCRKEGTKLFEEENPNLHYLWGDLRNSENFKNFPNDIVAAYYLVHSMSEIVTDLSKVELQVAENFIAGLKQTKIKQIIYLGGIINDEKKLSPHLQSRLLVEKILKDSGIPITILRASIIIGSGSASFEIIRDLCEKLPIMIAPQWLNSPCQPIAIQDVLFYLLQVLLKKECYNKTFDIGGAEILTFKDLLLKYSSFRNLKRYIFDIPILSPRISSYWLVFITSVKFSLCFYLVESIKKSSVVRLNEIQKMIPHKCLTFNEALKLAFLSIDENKAFLNGLAPGEINDGNPKIRNDIKVPTNGCLIDERKVFVTDSKEATQERIWQIGGKKGYYALNWAWKLRGWIDQFIGGVGLNRGRRHLKEIQVGDSIDFWRVLRADKEKVDLILFANMKMPGEAWLEFKIEQKNNRWILVQTATFRPKGILGRLYWYSLLPFHFIIFNKMAKALAGQ